MNGHTTANGHVPRPSERADPVKRASNASTRDTVWADGLRGISSLFVVTSHTAQAFFPWILQPSPRSEPPHLVQLPFLRIPFTHGRAVVAIFFILTGYVNALKPIAQSQGGDKKAAMTTLARSSIARTARLVFPATVITIITWFVCQLGFFQLALSSNSHWMRSTGGAPSSSWPFAVKDLLWGIIDTWFFMNDYYDQPQWTLAPLLKGSLWVYMTLGVTMDMRPEVRLATEAFMYSFMYANKDCLVGINIYAGMMLAELTYMLPPTPSLISASSTPTLLGGEMSYRDSRPNITRRLRPIFAILPWVAAILGLYLMSYPDRDHEFRPWSWQLTQIGQVIFPHDSHVIGFWPAIGAQIFCFAIFFSPTMKRALSIKPLLYAGTISFPLYLIHGPMMRSVLAWMVYGPMWLSWKPDPSNPGADPGAPYDVPNVNPAFFVIILPIFWSILWTAVHYWTLKVEPYFGRATKALEKWANMTPEQEGRRGGPP